MRVCALVPSLVLACFGCSSEPIAVRVVSADDMGTIEQSEFLRGRDGGYSVAAFGRSVWFFGDTTLNTPDQRGEQWLHDSWAFTDDLDASGGISLQNFGDSIGAPTEPFPFTEEEATFNAVHAGDPCQVEPCGARWALWPGAAVFDQERGRTLIFYGKISAQPGDFNFESVGQGVAVWPGIDQPLERPVVRPGADEPTLLFPPSKAPYGSAAWIDGDTLFAWGCRLDFVTKPCRVARVALADVMDETAWQFWNGQQWSDSEAEAKPVFDGNDILSVQRIDALGVLMVLYSQPLGRDVMIRTAPAPEGPWSDAQLAFVADEPASDNGWIYDALAHAELSEQGGLVQYVSYSRVTGFFEGELRLVRLTLAEKD